MSNFAEDLRNALDETDPISVDERYEDVLDGVEDVEEELHEPPIESQPSQTIESDDDNSLKDELEAEYGTLNAMTRAIHFFAMEMEKIDELNAITPHEFLRAKHAEIDGMSSSVEKQQAISVFNSFSVMFNLAKKNPIVRDFASELFGKTKAYYSFKKERKLLQLKLDIVKQMRYNKELENFNAKMKKREAEEQSASSKKHKACPF